MSEGTENAEAQKPSKYKGFGQKVWRVRPQGCTSCSAVQQALIESYSTRTPWNRYGSRGFCSALLLLTKELKKVYYNIRYITIVIIMEGLVHAAKNEGHCGDDRQCRH